VHVSAPRFGTVGHLGCWLSEFCILDPAQEGLAAVPSWPASLEGTRGKPQSCVVAAVKSGNGGMPLTDWDCLVPWVAVQVDVRLAATKFGWPLVKSCSSASARDKVGNQRGANFVELCAARRRCQ
jgi:hypothetical protein